MYVYIFIEYKERAGKLVESATTVVQCASVYVHVGIYDGGGGESDTHTRAAGNFRFPLPHEVHPFSRRAVSPTWGSTHKHTAAPSRTLNIMSARYFLFVSADVRTHRHTHTHIHTRFRNLLRSLCTCIHTHLHITPSLPTPPQTLLSRRLHTRTHTYYMCMCVHSLSHLFV